MNELPVGMLNGYTVFDLHLFGIWQKWKASDVVLVMMTMMIKAMMTMRTRMMLMMMMMMMMMMTIIYNTADDMDGEWGCEWCWCSTVLRVLVFVWLMCWSNNVKTKSLNCALSLASTHSICTVTKDKLRLSSIALITSTRFTYVRVSTNHQTSPHHGALLNHLSTCTLCRENALADNALLSERALFLSFGDYNAALDKDLLLPQVHTPCTLTLFPDFNMFQTIVHNFYSIDCCRFIFQRKTHRNAPVIVCLWTS